jgi:hypothetical protein
MDAVGHLPEALFATVFVVVIWGAQFFFLPLHHQQSLCGPRNMNGKSWSCGLGRGVTATFMAFATKTVDPGSFRFLVCDWFTACLWLTHVVDQAEE